MVDPRLAAGTVEGPNRRKRRHDPAGVATVVQLMGPLQDGLNPDPVAGRHQLMSDLSRLIGGLPPCDDGAEPGGRPAQSKPPHADLAPVGRMSPRMEQTLQHLLRGHSEKQAAAQLELSPHTVHVYVKQLYRRFGVSSRAELLALHLRRR